MKLRTTFAAALIVMVVSALPLFAGSPVELLRTGSFHGDEVAPNSAGPWFALVFDSDGAHLQSAEVSITAEVDPLLDDEGEASGRAVTITPPIEAVVLLRGIATLKPGRIPTALIDQTIERGDTVAVSVGPRHYTFAMHCVRHAPFDSQQQQDCHLTLEEGTAESSLFTYLAYSDGDQMQWGSERTPMVIWAGDIDGDDRLDVLLDTSNHSNGEDTTLYLSSLAAPGQVVKSVASFASFGC
jgi:hypothetical protein